LYSFRKTSLWFFNLRKIIFVMFLSLFPFFIFSIVGMSNFKTGHEVSYYIHHETYHVPDPNNTHCSDSLFIWFLSLIVHDTMTSVMLFVQGMFAAVLLIKQKYYHLYKLKPVLILTRIYILLYPSDCISFCSISIIIPLI
jgi:hypothetical protein